MGFECEEWREGGREGRGAGRRNKVGPRAGSQHAAKHKYCHSQTVFLIKFCASTQPLDCTYTHDDYIDTKFCCLIFNAIMKDFIQWSRHGDSELSLIFWDGLFLNKRMQMLGLVHLHAKTRKKSLQTPTFRSNFQISLLSQGQQTSQNR